MGKEIKLPDIPEEQQTPLVKVLLGIIEELAERVQRQEEEIGLLKDEIAVLKTPSLPSHPAIAQRAVRRMGDRDLRRTDQRTADR